MLRDITILKKGVREGEYDLDVSIIVGIAGGVTIILLWYLLCHRRKIICWSCGKEFPENQAKPVPEQSGKVVNLCPSCFGNWQSRSRKGRREDQQVYEI